MRPRVPECFFSTVQLRTLNVGRKFKMFLRRISVVGPKWLFAALSIVISTATFAAGLETNVDRKGMNFRRILLAAANPQLCQSECVGDAACKAFTYVKPTLKKRRAVCYLKTGVPKRSKTRCCVSGVRPVATSAHLGHFSCRSCSHTATSSDTTVLWAGEYSRGGCRSLSLVRP